MRVRASLLLLLAPHLANAQVLWRGSVEDNFSSGPSFSSLIGLVIVSVLLAGAIFLSDRETKCRIFLVALACCSSLFLAVTLSPVLRDISADLGKTGLVVALILGPLIYLSPFAVLYALSRLSELRRKRKREAILKKLEKSRNNTNS